VKAGSGPHKLLFLQRGSDFRVLSSEVGLLEVKQVGHGDAIGRLARLQAFHQGILDRAVGLDAGNIGRNIKISHSCTLSLYLVGRITSLCYCQPNFLSLEPPSHCEPNSLSLAPSILLFGKENYPFNGPNLALSIDKWDIFRMFYSSGKSICIVSPALGKALCNNL
jgi:hypothetical protein